MSEIVVKNPADIGTIIRQVRKRQGIRQDDLAAIIESSHVFMRDAERGKTSVQLGRVMRALDELGIIMKLDVPEAYLDDGKPRTRRGGPGVG